MPFHWILFQSLVSLQFPEFWLEVWTKKFLRSSLTIFNNAFQLAVFTVHWLCSCWWETDQCSTRYWSLVCPSDPGPHSTIFTYPHCPLLVSSSGDDEESVSALVVVSVLWSAGVRIIVLLMLAVSSQGYILVVLCGLTLLTLTHHQRPRLAAVTAYNSLLQLSPHCCSQHSR